MALIMFQIHCPFFFFFFFSLFFLSFVVQGNDDELRALMELKSSLDPEGRRLSSWVLDGEPCRGQFEGVACDAAGKVANISLQGKGLSGSISPAVERLRGLTGLYLHFNNISGEIPRAIANLTALTDLYLNVNNLSGGIPEECEAMVGLQVLQLSNNKLTGGIPPQLGLLKSLNLLTLQSNSLSGAIPATLGDLTELKWLDLSFNHIFGSVPVKLSQLSQLTFLDVQNNLLSGSVPTELKKLGPNFKYGNNTGLCGSGFSGLMVCSSSDLNASRPEPFSASLTPQDLPQSVNITSDCSTSHCFGSSNSPNLVIVIAATIATFGVLVCALMAAFWLRNHRKQNLVSALHKASNSLLVTDPTKCSYRTASPLISLEYSSHWDPLTDERTSIGSSQEAPQIYRFNLEEIECATQYFSEANLIGKKSSFAATYKGRLRDGTEIAVKRINKTSCKSEEAEFLMGLKALTLLRHENLIGLRGFCYSRARGECFLIYDFAANGSLSEYLDIKCHEIHNVLDWPIRVSIVKGIAKGMEYLHSNQPNKPSLLHQNLSSTRVLIDCHFNPQISGAGLHKLLAEDVIFSCLKTSAAMGYLAPEYAVVGRFSEKSDVYAFGVIVFQLLTGKTRTCHLRPDAESGKLEDLIDESLQGNYSKPEAAKLAGIALLCTSEVPNQRPTMEAVVQELEGSRCRN
ncbi:LRR receptor-like serine/threonine-protein kinase ER2 [Zingiber officinale]|uniref:LRR receptor-like serine/threonine-protein kinase ER2 n=1 Tax=Zingiber officinale TaxID=94328 RepID=UPI001C4DC508|nr:LRR receptor-like serine/threonine-protein kinase ER2 [Zingiber officinale]